MKSSSINYVAPCVFDLFVVCFFFLLCWPAVQGHRVPLPMKGLCLCLPRPSLLHNLKDFSDSDGFILISKRKAAHLGEEFKLL